MTTRLSLLACLLAGACLLAPAAARCSVPGMMKGDCQPSISGAITCKVGSSARYSKDSRFVSSDFSQTCIGDASQPCDAHANTVDRQNIKADGSTSCCSCYLYAHFVNPQASSGNAFVTDNKSPPAHTLVMPGKPCSGIESWNTARCGFEGIWDHAYGLLAKQSANWGMAINPVSRRGQHQMHVHLGQIETNLISAVVQGSTSLKSPFTVTCTRPKKDGKLCAAAQSGGAIKVEIVKSGTLPSSATPFESTYSANPDRNNPNVLKTSLLVMRLPGKADTWARVTNPAAQAECFFSPNDEGNC